MKRQGKSEESTGSEFPQVLFSSEKEDWGTPEDVFDALDKEFDFNLDAAAAAHNAKCFFYYDITDDALSKPWYPFQRVFLNPPYSRNIGDWVAKAREEADKGATVVLLIPARTDTRWFHKHVYGIAETRFLKGRIKFVSSRKTNHGATFPSVVIVMRPTDKKRIKTMAKHFTHIKSNVKVPVDSDLKQLNLVVGDNRSGKSSVVTDAIRLALTGKHPIGHHAKQLAGLAPTDAEQLYVELTNGNSQAKFYVDNLQSKPKKPRHSSPYEGGMPLAVADEILSYDKAKARAAIFTRFGEVKKVPTPGALDSAQKSMWKEGLKEVTGADAAERLAELSKWMRREKLARGREVKALEREIEELKNEAAEGIEELGTLEAQLEAAQLYEAQERSRVLIDEYEEKFEGLLDKVKGQKQRYQVKFGEKESLEFELEQSKQLEEQLERAKVALGIIDRVIAAGGHVDCPVCSSSTNLAGVQTAREVAVETVQVREKQYEAVLEMKSRYGAVTDELAELKTEVEQTEKEMEGAQKALSTLSEGTVEYDGPDAATLQERIRELRIMEASRAKLNEKVEGRRIAKKEAAIAKDLEKEAAKLLQDLLATVRKQAEEAVNRYMPDNFQVELNLEDDACEWVVVGDDNRGHNKSAMAGSEKAALVVGLALAWTEGQDIRVLSLDDESLAMLSPKNLQALLEKISEAADRDESLQVFAAWPAARIDHIDDIPSNWNVLRVGD